MRKPALMILTLVLALSGAILLSGCKDPDTKQVIQADKVKKDGDHEQAIRMFSSVAVKDGLSEEAVQLLQINYCQYYGDADLRQDEAVMTKENALAVAESCTTFYEKHPDRTSKGLGPFETALLYEKAGQYEEAIKMLILAEEKGFYDAKKTDINQREKKNCGTLYRHMMENAAKLPDDKNEETMEYARTGMEKKCFIKLEMRVE